jgi:hypothetical protein
MFEELSRVYKAKGFKTILTLQQQAFAVLLISLEEHCVKKIQCCRKDNAANGASDVLTG